VRYVQKSGDEWRDRVYDRMRLNALTRITLQIYCLAHISLGPQRIPFVIFAFDGIKTPLSSPALLSTARWLTVKICRDYCLFWNTWFNFLSGQYYSLSYYLGVL
jgi:hypothetical protein